LAERILAEWNGKSTKKYHYLGVVEGTVKLPTPPKAGYRWLCIYLIPSTTAKEKWYSKLPVHRLTAYFGKYSFHNRQWPGSNIPFSIQGVTPGQYWVKAVWDKAEPYSFDDKNIKGPPQQGDYESLESPTITVRAGKTVEKIIIDCTNKVTNGTD
jgi:hypothetical protein